MFVNAFVVSILLNAVSAFIPISSVRGRQFCIFSDVTGSPATPIAESPLVERALDSALDFLQDGETESDEEDDDDFGLFEIYEESPDFEINYDLIREYESKEAEALANKRPSSSELFKIQMKSAIEKWRKHETDVGSAEVQIAIANERIKQLTAHLLKNKFDVHGRRGLDKLVTLRRVCLNYLYETNRPKAEEMVAALGIRYRAPGRLWDKEAKYAAFKNTKSKVKKTVRTTKNIATTA